MKKVGFLVVGSFLVGSGAVGQWAGFESAVGQFGSGQFGSGAVGSLAVGSGAVGQWAGFESAVGQFGSGAVGSLAVGSSAVGSGAVGQWAGFESAVGQFGSGAVGSGAVGSGQWGSGQWGSGQWGSEGVGVLDTGRIQRHLHTLSTPCRDFTTDKLQNVYVVDKNNRVHKYGPDGREQFHFNNNTRGTLQYIDPTDPFNLLLFYPELQVVATLDRTMNETAVLELFTAGIFNATAIGLATDNNIWVYDQAAFRLKKVGQNGEVLIQSDNLSSLLDAPPIATQLLANNNIVYLNCPGQGVYVFDNFGQFHQLLPYPDVVSLQLQDGKLVLYSDHRVRAYNPETLQEQVLRGGINSDVQVRYQGNRVYEKEADDLVRVFSRTP
ncbi:hypothetical protein [Phaeodactylibacter xiamenensis]|uniref:hypothetical protein n=1 Tax=Phaeodactylibacter xiamenensis TaxID=1524460 RepID=UPI003BAA20EC